MAAAFDVAEVGPGPEPLHRCFQQVRRAVEIERVIRAHGQVDLTVEIPLELRPVPAQALGRVVVLLPIGEYGRVHCLRRAVEHGHRVRVPVLILQGQTDQQVAPEQAELLGSAMRQAGNARVTVQILPNVNHMFLDDPDGRPSGYSNLPSRRISTQALRLISDWVTEQLRK